MRDGAEKRAIFLGAIIGAVSGAVVAALFRRWRRGRPAGEHKPIEAGQVVRLVGAIVTVVRQFVKLMA